MPTVHVRHRPNPQVIADLLTGPATIRDLWRRGIRVQTAAKRRLAQSPKRIDTGRLWNSIAVDEIRQGGVPGIRVGTNVDYAIYVHDGTRYMEANPFLKDALAAAAG